MKSWVESALAAEARAVEEGHHARWDDQRRLFLVKSDSSDRDYEITVRAIVPARPCVSPWLSFGCTCPAAQRGRHRSEPVPCKHAALVARRLEREGLAAWDGSTAPWVPLGPLLEAALADSGHAVPLATAL